MRDRALRPLAAAVCTFGMALWVRAAPAGIATVPFTLDHNRLLVTAEIQRLDGSWRPARLWVDTGNPSFFLTPGLARDLGLEPPAAPGGADVPPPPAVRLGGVLLDFAGVPAKVMAQPPWLFGATHADANLPSTVLRRYRVVFDYPRRQLTLTASDAPGAPAPRGERAAAVVHPETGIVQIDAVVDGDSLSFALDMGASYSFVSADVVERLAARHPDWPRLTGTAGCANMWGWWPPGEASMPLVRVPEIRWGPARLAGVGLVGVAEVAPGGPPLGAWYSRKTARPVAGFLGPNAFRDFRVEIDYAGGAVWFERGAEPGEGGEGGAGGSPGGRGAPGDAAPDASGSGAATGGHDLDLVGLALRLEADGRYTVVGVPSRDGRPVVAGVEPGDVLLSVDGFEAAGATMGAVVDALRGRPGEARVLTLERAGTRFRVEAPVAHLL